MPIRNPKLDILNNERGLTMLELLVALVILSIGIVGVLRAFSSSTLTCKAAESHSNMALLAQQVAGELERQAELETGDLSGTFGPDFPDYTWEADVQQAAEANLYRAEIRVVHTGGDRRKFYRLFTCLRKESQEASSDTPPSPGPPPGPEGPG